MTEKKTKKPERLKTFLKKKAREKGITKIDGKKFTNFFASIKAKDKGVIEESYLWLIEEKQLDFWPEHKLESDHIINKGREYLHDGLRIDDFYHLHHALAKHYDDVRVHWNSNANHRCLQDYTNEESGEINSSLWHNSNQVHPHVPHIDNVMKSYHTDNHSFYVYSGVNRTPEMAARDEHGFYNLHFKSYTSTSLSPHIAKMFCERAPRDTEHWYHEYGVKASPEHVEQYHRQLDANMRHSIYNNEDSKRVKDEVFNSPIAKSLKQAQEKYGRLRAYKHVLQIYVPKESHGVYVGHVSNHKDEFEHILHRGACAVFHPNPSIDHSSGHVYWHGKLVHDGVNKTSHWKEHYEE